MGPRSRKPILSVGHPPREGVGRGANVTRGRHAAPAEYTLSLRLTDLRTTGDARDDDARDEGTAGAPAACGEPADDGGVVRGGRARGCRWRARNGGEGHADACDREEEGGGVRRGVVRGDVQMLFVNLVYVFIVINK